MKIKQLLEDIYYRAKSGEYENYDPSGNEISENLASCPLCRKFIHYSYLKRHLVKEHGWSYTRKDGVFPTPGGKTALNHLNQKRNSNGRFIK